MKTTTWMGLAYAATFAASWCDDAMACFYLTEDHRFVQLEAPVGGVWWIPGVFENVSDTVELRDLSGNVHYAEVVLPYLEGAIALRVPTTTVVGDQLNPPAGADNEFLETLPVLTVVAGDQVDEMTVVSAPILEVEMKRTAVGYQAVATVGETSCGREFGIWSIRYSGRPWLIGDVPEGHVLDVVVQERGASPFEDLAERNAIFMVARQPGSVSEHFSSVGGAFDVNARLRRASDGATGPTMTIEADATSELNESQLEFQGCASTETGRRGIPLVCLLGAVFGYRRGLARQRAGR